MMIAVTVTLLFTMAAAFALAVTATSLRRACQVARGLRQAALAARRPQAYTIQIVARPCPAQSRGGEVLVFPGRVSRTCALRAAA